MKLGKFKLFLTLLLAFVMALAIVGCATPDNDDDPPTGCDCCENCEDCICEAGKDCNPDCTCGSENCNPETTPPADETAPVITFAEGKQDSYSVLVGQSVTLPLATANDETDGAVEVTVTVDGATVTKDTAGYIFTADEQGTYTVTYSAKDAANNEVKETITVTVEADTTAPVITFGSGKQDSYTIVAGQVAILPLATATDNVDGEVEVDVSVTSKGATVVKDDDAYLFTSNTAGEYKVSYYAIDEAENEAEEFITVIVTPVVAESALPEGASNDISVLEEGGTYVENFAKGYSGALAKGFTYSTATGEPNASVRADEFAIAGNSLVIDYTSCAWNTNTQFWFGSLDNYIKSGRWTISMDVKVLGGTAPSGLYMSFVADGSESGTDQACAFENDEQGKTKLNVVNHISTSGLYTFDENLTWHFRLFFYTGDSSYKYDNFVIAIDNISITYKEVVNDVVERTGAPKTVSLQEASATNGYTITGANENYTIVSGSGAPVQLDKSKVVLSERLTQEQANNLTATNGFNSDYVILANAQLNWFDALRGLCTDSGYIYTLTLKVYAVETKGWHFFFADGAGNGASSIKGITINAGVSTISCEFAGATNMVQIGLYLNGVSDLYIGDITISAVEKPVDKSPNGYEVGQTWTKSAAELNGCNEGQIVTCSEVTVGGAALSSNAGFENSAVYYSAANADKNFWMFRAGGTIENGCTYKIIFTLYVTELNNRICVNFDNAVFETVTTATGYQVVEFNWTATKTVDFFSLYFDGTSTGSVYIASVSYELIAL